ncbi:MAG: SUF system NifU family Fe-S cluster assembly protein [Candidatus Woykebacteria bacterium]
MIEDQLYRQAILEVAKNPKNRGEIERPDLEARLVNPLCGDEIKLQLKIQHPTSKIEEAMFSGNGCAISQASASLLAEYVVGKSIDEVEKVNSSDILELIGINPTPARLKCAFLSLDTLREALKDDAEGQG